MTSAIELKGVAKSFPGDIEIVEALRGVTFDVAQREFVAVVGTSGCGKSTLLRILGGLMPLTSGDAKLYGERIRGPAPEIGIVFQTPVLLPWRSVRRNIELQLDIRGLDRARYANDVQDLIALVGLQGFEESKPYELSGGMQQRVALCRALIHQPSLLLMDEPFGALDALTRETMNLELQRIWMETQKTIIFVTHSIIEAVFLADRVVVMSSRPGEVRDIVRVSLGRPRNFESMKKEEFHLAVDKVRGFLDASTIGD